MHEVLVSQGDRPLHSLDPCATVGTGSLRRQAQLRRYRPDLQMVDIRGNIETRLRQVQSGRLDAVVLAAAGLFRLGLESLISEELHPLQFLPAVGQGALGLEIRAEDPVTFECVRPLVHLPTLVAVRAERALLRTLRGGCLSPIGAWARPTSAHDFQLDAEVLSRDGQQRVAVQDTTTIQQHAMNDGPSVEQSAEQWGVRVAQNLIDQGAHRLLTRGNDANQSDQSGPAD